MSKKLTPGSINKIEKHWISGEWRRSGTLAVNQVDATDKWEKKSTGKVVSLQHLLTVDMDNLLIKLETAQRGHYEALPKTPIEIFSIASAGDFSLEN